MRRNSRGAKTESRVTTRRSVELKCAVLAESWGTPMSFNATDLSEYGLWLEAELPLQIGTEVAVVFTPPQASEPIYVAGEVRRVRDDRESGMGIVFAGLRPEDRRMLTASLQGLLPREASNSLYRTLPGVPIARASSQTAIDQDTSETLSGWPAPRLTRDRRHRHSGIVVKRDATTDRDDAITFGGGLELIASVFGVRR